MTQFQRLARAFTVGLLLALSAICHAADAPTGAEPPHVTQLRPGDPLSIQVVGQPDAANVFVGDDGMINVPLVGNVQVGGLAPIEAAGKIAKALKDGGFYVDPHVTVVTQPRGQIVTVLGEVRNAGRFTITPGTSILDLLAQAGGVNQGASDTGYVLRKNDNGQVNRYPVKLNGLSDLKETLPTSSLLGGDTLVVPTAGTVYVTGEVTTPGKISMEPGMTVMQAILHAGGVNERGSEHRIELKRLTPDGQYKTVHAKAGDPVQADDVIRVKESLF
jgi:polysaccharide biosynthesis/export protein